MNLNLSNTKMGLRGCTELAKGLSAEEAPRLKHLDLSGNHIEAEGFAKLMQKLKTSTSIVTLNVSDNEMSLYQENFDAVCSFLKQNKSLLTLTMNHCGISNRAMKHLSHGLKYNTAL